MTPLVSGAARVATVHVPAHHPDHHQRAGENEDDEEQLSHSRLRPVGVRVASLTAT
jgi:hypothetical protein